MTSLEQYKETNREAKILICQMAKGNLDLEKKLYQIYENMRTSHSQLVEQLDQGKITPEDFAICSNNDMIAWINETSTAIGEEGPSLMQELFDVSPGEYFALVDPKIMCQSNEV